MNTAGTPSAPGLLPGGNRARLSHLLEFIAVGVVLIAILALGLSVVTRFLAPDEPAGTPTGTIATAVTLPEFAATHGDTTLALSATVAGDGAAIEQGSVTFAIVIDGQRVTLPASGVAAGGVATASAALPPGLAAGTYTVEATYGGDGSFAASRATGRLVIAPASATVALASLGGERVYDGSPQAAVATTDPAGLPVAFTYRRDGVAVAVPVAAGTYEVEATVADPNFRGATRGTLVIARATPALVWQPPVAITYGTPLGTAQFGATAAVDGTFAYHPPLGAILPAGADQTLTATFTPSDGGNFTAATARVPLTVLKAPLRVAADNQARTYGAANPPLTVAIQGFVNGETAAILGDAPRLTTEAGPASPVGAYPIKVAGGELTAANYAITFAPGTLTITPAPLTVAVDNAARVYGAPDPAFTGTVAGLVNGDEIAATFGTAARATSPVGAYPITATLADPGGKLGNYAAAVTPGTLTIGIAGSVATVTPVAAREGDAVILRAKVEAAAPSAAMVDEGSATFTIARDGKVALTVGPVAVRAGAASAEVSLWGLDSGDYTLAVAYGEATNFGGGDGTAALALANAAPTATFAIPAGPVTEGDGFTIALLNPVDPSAADQAAGFGFAFDRGDGRWFVPPAGLGHATVVASDDPGQVVRARITDREGATTVYTLTVPVANAAPVAQAVAMPTLPVTHSLAIPLQAIFVDPGILDRHTAVWDWGDGTTGPGTVVNDQGTVTVTGEHRYARGVYAVGLAVTDDSGATGRIAYRYVVVDDGEQAAAVGTALYTSPAGALLARPDQTGLAALGFVAGQSAGSTDLRFHLGDLDFAGVYYAWVPAPVGQLRFEALGTINGTGDYRLVLVAQDGQRPNGEGDLIRIAIWDRATGALVYDSQPGAAAGADPATPLVTGDVIVRASRIAYQPSITVSADGQVVGLLER